MTYLLWGSPALTNMVEAILSGVANIPTAGRIKIGRLIEAMTGGTALVESMHGAGSPQAQRVIILRDRGKDGEKTFGI